MRPPLPSSSPLLQRMLIRMCLLSNILKNFSLFLKKPVDSSGCAAAIGSSNHITEEMAIDCLKYLSELLISRLCEEKERIKEQGKYLWWFPQIT